MLLCHTNLTKEDIFNSSLAFLFAIASTLNKRMCEKLGVPYSDTKETEISQDEIDKDQNAYPLKKSENKIKYEKNTSETKVFQANSKGDLLQFFSGIADFEK